MDYLVELARHPDILQAIDIEGSPAAQALRRLAFLTDEHANTWIAEVVHAFYADPEFASRVWVNLRYCDTFRKVLAERVLDLRSARWGWRTVPQDVKRLLPEEHVAAFKKDRARSIAAWAKQLASNPEPVNILCEKTNTFPSPPTFLADLMDAMNVSDATRDAQTQELLRHPTTVRKLARDHSIGVPFSLVLEQELDQIRTTREAVHRSKRHDSLRRPQTSVGHSARQALDENLLGLAFSGGGIRSATFNLGVLQALSKIGLLKQFDYLSTVSGGGYIGSWLSAWTHRESLKHENPADAIAEVQRRLSPTRSPNPLDERVKPIRFLREYSNYLTPRTGFFSADTWTMLGIYARNTLLNQVIIVSLFAAILLTPRLMYALTALPGEGAWLFLPALPWLIGAVLLVLNLQRLDPHSSETLERTGSPMPAGPTEVRPPWYAQPRVIQIGVVLAWLLASWLLAIQRGAWAVSGDGAPNVVLAAASVGALVGASLLLILAFGRSDRCWTGRAGWKGAAEAVPTIAGSAAVAGAVAAGLTWVLLKALIAIGDKVLEKPTELAWHLTAIGTAGLMSVLSLAIVALLGMLGEKFPDEHREWWSKIRTFIHVYALGWLAWFAVAMYVPLGLQTLHGLHLGWKSSLTALMTWIAATVFGVKKGQTAEDDRKQQETKSTPSSVPASVLRYAALVAPFVFIAGLVVAISLAIDAIFRHNYLPEQVTTATYWHYAEWTARQWTWAWTLACVGVGLLFSWRVDINEFSIHHFYKNRLVRCYLGASRSTERKADWFTGFDPNDDLRLAVFDNDVRDPGKPYPGPYPIVNCSLNLVGGQDLAWQERKATSFVFTPKHCGYDLDRAVLTKTHDLQRSEAYVPTRSYYRTNEGPLLGMAMAISGAAANPNMGRATSPASAFLMTVFNVRLGWWIGNPRHEDGCPLPGPRLGLTYTALELFGGTDDSRKFINLSDGGHFDNLGVYELIRRGCRYIVVCDAGQDGPLVCEDLGDLVRRCRTDFGVEIDIAVDRIRDRNAAGISQSHCVVGKIHYLNIPKRDTEGRLVNEDGGPVVPGSRPAHEEGYLVYIKPSMTGDEPQDVLEYYRRIPEFPHQSTADQWFNESQFESYRKLGMHVGEQTFSRYQQDDVQSVGNLQDLFDRLYGYWYPPSLAINDRSSVHAAEYSRILEMVRNQRPLRGLDHAIFASLPIPATSIEPRDEFYVCNALVQLIENVYVDLELEQNWNHPHVEGWMRVFIRWARQPSFRRTWKIAESTYGARFRNFYNDRLCGRPLGLPRAFVASRGGLSGAVASAAALRAFEEAIAAGAAVLELDVSKIGSDLIVGHDLKFSDCLDALRGRIQLGLHLKGPGIGSPTRSWGKTLAVTIARLYRLRYLHHRGAHRTATAIEFVSEAPGIESEVLKTLRDRGWSVSDVVLTSFDRRMMKKARDCSNEVRLGLLVRDRHSYEEAVKDFLEIHADFLAPEESIIQSESDLHRAEEYNVPVVPWPVNDEGRLRMFLSHGIVAGVITDNVPLALSVKRQL